MIRENEQIEYLKYQIDVALDNIKKLSQQILDAENVIRELHAEGFTITERKKISKKYWEKYGK